MPCVPTNISGRPLASPMRETSRQEVLVQKTVSFGLMLSTLLTLVVIPAVYLVVPSRVRAEDELEEPSPSPGLEPTVAGEVAP